MYEEFLYIHIYTYIFKYTDYICVKNTNELMPHEGRRCKAVVHVSCMYIILNNK